MEHLRVKYLGVPKLTLNGKEVYMPFAKAEGLLFYVLHEKNALRDRLCTMFWGGQGEANAKKNLRNAVYAIRKASYGSIIISPRRAMLEADDQCSCVSDLDELRAFCVEKQHAAADTERFLALYEGDFMQGPLSAECSDYEEWTRAWAQTYRREYVDKLQVLFHRLIREKRWHEAQHCGEKLIALDEFEELSYRSLMFVYKEQGKYAECVEVYSRLEGTLRKGLSVRPSAQTRRFFESIIQKQALGKSGARQEELFGREGELALLRRSLAGFAGGGTFSSYLILGEAGIGKTRLLESAAAAGSGILLRASCYEAETGFLFKLWDRIFEQLSYFLRERSIAVPPELAAIVGRVFPTLQTGPEQPAYELAAKGDGNMAEKAVFDLFSFLARKASVLFLIDDLHWADKSSLDLLCKVMFANREKIMLVGVCRTEYAANVDRLYFSLSHAGGISKLSLERFTEQETKKLVHRLMPDADEHSGKIYHESAGNPLFITEIVNSLREGRPEEVITDKMAVLIGGRILALSPSAQKLLSICAMFYSTFNLKILASVMEVGGMELVELIDELLAHSILREAREPDGEICLCFTHPKIREYIYQSISASKRALLHERIAEHYEGRLTGGRIDRIFYPKLIHHYTLAENGYQRFRCQLLQLRTVLDASHEIFPRADIRESGVLEYYTDEEALDSELEELRELYGRLRERGRGEEELGEWEPMFLLLYGRFHKDRGIPEKGYEAILRMIAISKERGYREYALEGYLQLIQYAINICNLSMMEEAVENAGRYAAQGDALGNALGNAGEAALVLRYRGYLHVLRGEHESGETLLLEALRSFCALGDYETYRMNLAACCFYLGESRRLQQRYEEALECYDKAFDHCDEELHFSAVAVILSRIGYSGYLLGHSGEARFYLLKSLQAYNRTIFAWGRADVYYSLALIELNGGHPDMAKKYIEGAVLFSNKYDASNLRDTIATFQKKLVGLK